MSLSMDEEEHSIEMHLPYIHKMLSRASSNQRTLLSIVPILVGHTSPSTERKFGELLAPYLADPANVFVVSSDFAHWGTRFNYTYYQPATSSPCSLKSSSKTPTDPPIHESIGNVDMACIEAVESGKHKAFLDTISRTSNTVCGRHPIGIVMAAMEVLKADTQGQATEGRPFSFVRYERSSDCVTIRDSSVSYASAFAVL
ncbi:MAG: hypothetical protein M1828_000269 [Chrysothrix sp. TS-e1954]|nr:MAG: hypothetical protein M1828_000269 [Chrysothrix sp. TS-e1954]